MHTDRVIILKIQLSTSKRNEKCLPEPQKKNTESQTKTEFNAEITTEKLCLFTFEAIKYLFL